MGHWHGEVSSNVTFAYCTKGCIDVAVLRGRPVTHVYAKSKSIYRTFPFFFLHENSRRGCIRVRKLSYLTICEATARSTKLRKMQSYKSVFYQKKKRFCLLQPYLIWMFLSHWSRKTYPKFVAHWKVCQKMSQREVIRKNAYIAPKPQGLLLPALHLKFSRSLTNFQASPARQSSHRSKDRCPNHAVV